MLFFLIWCSSNCAVPILDLIELLLLSIVADSHAWLLVQLLQIWHIVSASLLLMVLFAAASRHVLAANAAANAAAAVLV